ncbi:hypothetical protein N7520_002300 [Penicillium odoratum]|uniref:uncharacterized protein n=1 Tax=Penicillium odoratum TaxID=1167516 RepID=UPI002546DC2B|nr:uncharacterized protein N7520_002300 [Penicillium odoratum]KAJ5771771.1 hypothetical protein N7520_002300 [Penicillium odoratum]
MEKLQLHTRLMQALEDDPLFSGKKEEKVKRYRPMKRLILCLDGSWQSSNHGEKNIASNIVKLSRSIDSCEKTKDKVIQQIVYYDAGVGTGKSAPRNDASIPAKVLAKGQKIFEGTFERGLEENVCEAYNFLVNNCHPGDEIYIFGFSRGAYTARAVEGLVSNMGICFPDMMNDWWSIYDEYKKRSREEPKPTSDKINASNANQESTRGQDHVKEKSSEEEPKSLSDGIDVSNANKENTSGQDDVKMDWKSRFYKGVQIQVVGVVDTVGALGWPSNKLVPAEDTNATKYGFHDTKLHINIKNAFHALALDEHRYAFPPTLWSLPKGISAKEAAKKGPRLVQCWFPGYHINIGGGSDETLKHYDDMESMANPSLVWMIDQVRKWTNLTFKNYALAKFYHHYTHTIRQDVPDPENLTAYGGWGMGYRPDSINTVTGYSGSTTRTPGQYKKVEETQEYIHPVVTYAMGKAYRQAHAEGTILSYQPPALAGFEGVLNPKVYSTSETGKKTVDTLDGCYWRKKIKGVKYADTPYLTRLSIWYNKSHPPEEDDDILIPEMKMLEDSDRSMFNERDYMRADWFALWASLMEFHDDVKRAIQNFPLTQNQSASEDTLRRERFLLTR